MKNFTLLKNAILGLTFLLPSVFLAQTCVTTVTSYPYTESFEGSGSGGIGAWVQDTGDTTNWSTRTNQTPSGGTGPLTASDLSYYIYTEATGNPLGTAFLNSPCFDLTGIANPEFSFDYHMFGTAAEMGNLKIQVSTDNGTSWSDIGWNQNGIYQTAGGDPWATAVINLIGYTGQTIKLRFHGTIGAGYRSDMSVDNANLYDNTVSPGVCTSTISAFPYNEGFEGAGSGGIGAWIQNTGDDGDWATRTGGTPSANTGPSGATEASYYLYTEATGSNPGSPNKIAIIESPCFDLTGLSSPKFNYSYHMYGSNMGTLKTQISTNNGSSWADIGTTLSGNQHVTHASPWSAAIVDLTAYVGQTIMLRFHGTTGADYRSDMAIDGISIIDDVPYSEIDILGNAISIVSGDPTPSTADDTDYDTVIIGSPVSHTFTITNTGNINLNIGAITFSGANAAEFTVITPPSPIVAASGSTTFTVQFNPTAVGLRTATISIVNDDATGGENPYTFALQGTGSTPAPEINITGLGVSIASGDVTPNTVDDTDFGTTTIGTSVSHTFTIQNTGSLTLNVGPITFTGPALVDFTVTTPPAATVSAGGNTTFVVQFNPTGTGFRTAILSLVNNDPDENPYTFTVEGFVAVGDPTHTIYYENFDENNGSWTASTGSSSNWAHGTGLTGSSVTESAEGSYWYTDNFNDYGNNAFATVESPIISTAGFNNVRFSSDIRYNVDADDDDGMIVQYRKRTLGVWSTWTILGANGQGTNWYDGNGNVDAIASGSDGWTGDTNTSGISNYFQTAFISVPSSLENSDEIQFRFVFASDGSTTDDGVVFDNVLIYGDPITPLTPPTFAPGSITNNLKLWLKATSEIGSISDGSDIITWDDNAYDNNAVGVTGESPSFSNNSTDNINFNPVIVFDRSNTEYMRGKGGFSSHDYFVAIKSNGTIDYTAANRQVPIAGRVSTSTFYNDGTGLGLGNISQRFSDEVVAHMSSSVPGTSTPASEKNYGRALTSTTVSYVDEVIIYNVKTDAAHTVTEIYKNGIKIDNTTGNASGSSTDYFNFSEFLNQQFYLGVGRFSLNGNVDAYVDGKITEIISYSDTNDLTNQQKILSYLSLKNGVTLHASNSTTATNLNDTDYIDSAGFTIWDTSANAGFNYDVAGIGRDDASEFNQKQSKTVNTTQDITIGLGDLLATNDANTNTFFVDREYLVWGNDNGTLAAQPPVMVDMSTGISGLNTIVDFTAIGRTWKVTETGGNVGITKISIPEIMLSATITPPGDYLMFISDTPTFTPTAEYRIMSLNGADLETTYDFNGIKYITFGYAPERTFTRSIYFDGAQDYLDAGDVLDLPSAFTISAWINRQTNTQGSIVSKRNGVTPAMTAGYDFKINASGQLEISWINGVTLSLTSAVSIPLNEWHHVAVCYTGLELNLYIDGVQAANLSPSILLPAPNSQSFIIGAAGGIATTNHFNGNLDEIRVWDIALTANQLRYIMNQEIEENSTFVEGSYFAGLGATPTKDEVGTIDWGRLQGYYPLSVYTYTNCKDHSNNDYTAAIKNLTTVDYQTAPLPYQSANNGNWDVNAIWLNGTEQTIPGAASLVNNTITVDWNIIDVNHNITMDNVSLPTSPTLISGLPTNIDDLRTVLSLNVIANELTIDADNALSITHYLKVDGTIDLVGESQLIQTNNSDLDTSSGGNLERDQQGTADTYTYNYWSAPVSTINTSSNNQNYTVSSLLRDGTTPTAPGAITFLTSGYNGTNTNPIGIADYWIWKFANGPGTDTNNADYAYWQHVRSTGSLLVGEGFTLKGPGTGSIVTPQNYVFTGKPNNGDVNVNITSGHDYLVGNPYPSAIDAHEFLDDNPLTGGTLYFWEHWGGGSHALNEYQGGYAQYNYSGGTGAASYGTNDPDVGTGGTATKLPGQFIPVAQGFFVTANATGSVKFENDQRVYMKESIGTSVFVRNSNVANNTVNYFEDDRMKFRIGFNSYNEIHRQLLLTVDDNATSGVDWGYDGKVNEEQIDDMYWMIDDVKYVIQGTNVVTTETVAPLGLHVRDDGMNYITIDHLENVPGDVNIYVHDNVLDIYHDLKVSDYQVYLNTGEYLNRFAIVFITPEQQALDVDDNELDDSLNVYYNSDSKSIIIENPTLIDVESLELFTILGQSIISTNDIETQNYTEIKVKNLSTGAYIINLNSGGSKISKKVLVK